MIGTTLRLCVFVDVRVRDAVLVQQVLLGDAFGDHLTAFLGGVGVEIWIEIMELVEGESS